MATVTIGGLFQQEGVPVEFYETKYSNVDVHSILDASATQLQSMGFKPIAIEVLHHYRSLLAHQQQSFRAQNMVSKQQQEFKATWEMCVKSVCDRDPKLYNDRIAFEAMEMMVVNLRNYDPTIAQRINAITDDVMMVAVSEGPLSDKIPMLLAGSVQQQPQPIQPRYNYQQMMMFNYMQQQHQQQPVPQMDPFMQYPNPMQVNSQNPNNDLFDLSTLPTSLDLSFGDDEETPQVTPSATPIKPVEPKPVESAQPVEQVEKEVEAPEALIEKEEEKVEAKDEEKKIEGEKAEMKEVDNKSEEERSYLLPTPSAAPLNAQPKKFSAQKKSPWDGKNDWKKKFPTEAPKPRPKPMQKKPVDKPAQPVAQKEAKEVSQEEADLAMARKLEQEDLDKKKREDEEASLALALQLYELENGSPLPEHYQEEPVPAQSKANVTHVGQGTSGHRAAPSHPQLSSGGKRRKKKHGKKTASS